MIRASVDDKAVQLQSELQVEKQKNFKLSLIRLQKPVYNLRLS